MIMDSCQFIEMKIAVRGDPFERCQVTNSVGCLYHESKSYENCPIIKLMKLKGWILSAVSQEVKPGSPIIWKEDPNEVV